jgi:regulator of protease activity HflC (stomatin/prohibitin superfamily)
LWRHGAPRSCHAALRAIARSSIDTKITERSKTVRIVVQEWERVLLYKNGQFEQTLAAGRHWRLGWRRRVLRVSVRPRLMTVPGQEVLTADGLSVKLSLLVRVRIADPRRWHESVEAPDVFVYAAVQVAVREATAVRTLDELLASRGELGPELAAAAARTAAEVGVSVEEVALRDVMLPAELRRAATEAASARAHGLASLERARGEVASTRALANAAKMVADNPALLQLRTLQAVEAGGATVVLTTDGAGGLPGVVSTSRKSARARS